MTMIVSGSDGLEFPDGSDQTSAFTGNAAAITSGTIATARLATGTANATTFLRGDSTWATITQLPIVITPVCVSPTTGATNIFPGQVLSATGFFALYGYTFANAQWQISTSAGFGTTVFDSGTSGAAVTSITTNVSYLSTNTTYYWRVRYKASDGTFSDYSTAFSFTTATAFSYAIDYLVIAGGGSGGANSADGNQRQGGGGAGGFRTATGMTLDVGTAYTVTVGAGASNPSGDSTNNGSNSVFNGITSTGGGGGGTVSVGANSGGSGGGGSAGGGTTGAAGTAGQGNAGGNSSSFGGVGGGGGGAGSAASGGAGGSGIVIIRYSGAQRGTGGTVTSSGGNTIHTFTSSGTYTA